MIGPVFYPAPWRDLEEYQAAASTLLPSLAKAKAEGNADDATAIVSTLKEMFEGTRGILKVREGRVGWGIVSVSQYDPAVLRSMLPSHADLVIRRDGSVNVDALEKLVAKLRKARILDQMYAREIIKSGRASVSSGFTAEPSTEVERANFDADTSALRPGIKPERFKGRHI